MNRGCRGLVGDFELRRQGSARPEQDHRRHVQRLSRLVLALPERRTRRASPVGLKWPSCSRCMRGSWALPHLTLFYFRGCCATHHHHLSVQSHGRPEGLDPLGVCRPGHAFSGMLARSVLLGASRPASVPLSAFRASSLQLAEDSQRKKSWLVFRPTNPS